MDALMPKQRQHLKGLAHKLKPLLHVGKEGVTHTAARALADAFNTRELIKLKVLEAPPEPAKETGAELARRVAGAHLVQVIGRTVVLYRPHPEKPQIKLPRPNAPARG